MRDSWYIHIRILPIKIFKANTRAPTLYPKGNKKEKKYINFEKIF